MLKFKMFREKLIRPCSNLIIEIVVLYTKSDVSTNDLINKGDSISYDNIIGAVYTDKVDSSLIWSYYSLRTGIEITTRRNLHSDSLEVFTGFHLHLN